MELHKDGNFLIAAKDDTPEIIISDDNTYLKISGPSFPENANEFYTPIIKKAIDIKPDDTQLLTCEFNFSILSSASNKMIYEMLTKLEKIHQQGKPILIRWFYDTFDEDMLEEGEGFKESLNLDFELIEKKA